MRQLEIICEKWPITGAFRIARGRKTHAHTVMAALHHDGHTGRGECVPYAHYGESVQSVVRQIEALRNRIESGLTKEDLQAHLPAGAARNALDCALWDLQAKLSGIPVWKRAALPAPKPLPTAFTIALDPPPIMAEKAKQADQFSLLKLKLAGDGMDLERLNAIKAARKDAALILDANEGLNLSQLKNLLPKLATFNIALIEQPLPANQDHVLEGFTSPIPLCADESLHTSQDLDRLAGLYDAINIKLDKTGGLSQAITLARKAKTRGLKIMLGCMVGTSLGMAPSMMLASLADYIDLDGPLLLDHDRQPGLTYDGALISPPKPALWG